MITFIRHVELVKDLLPSFLIELRMWTELSNEWHFVRICHKPLFLVASHFFLNEIASSPARLAAGRGRVFYYTQIGYSLNLRVICLLTVPIYLYTPVYSA